MRKIIMASITAVVVIAVLAGTLIPVLDDATADSDTFDNTADALYRVSKLDSTSEYVMEYTAGSDSLNINGTDVTRESGTVYCDVGGYLIRDRGTYIQYVTSSSNSTIGDSSNSFELTLSAGTVTLTVNDESTTIGAFTSAYAIDPQGDYVMKSPTQEAYVLDDSEIFAMGITTLDGNWRNIFQISGNVTGVTVTNVGGSYTVDNVVIDATQESDHEDLWTIEKITFDATSGDSTTEVTYSYFIVPAEVTAERSVHFTDGENAILDAIPVIVIIALLLGVVAIVLRSRMD